MNHRLTNSQRAFLRTLLEFNSDVLKQRQASFDEYAIGASIILGFDVTPANVRYVFQQLGLHQNGRRSHSETPAHFRAAVITEGQSPSRTEPTTMSFLDINLTDVPDRRILEGDREYQLRCTAAEVKDSKSTEGSRYLELVLEPLAEPDADQIYDRIGLPSDADEDRKKVNKMRRMKAAAQAFGLPLTGFDVNDFIGKTVWAIISLRPAEGSYPERNEIQRYIVAK